MSARPRGKGLDPQLLRRCHAAYRAAAKNRGSYEGETVEDILEAHVPDMDERRLYRWRVIDEARKKPVAVCKYCGSEHPGRKSLTAHLYRYHQGEERVRKADPKLERTIVSEYRRGDRVADISERHQIGHETIYMILDIHQVPRRKARMAEGAAEDQGTGRRAQEDRVNNRPRPTQQGNA